jgi:hypothetical protein
MENLTTYTGLKTDVNYGYFRGEGYLVLDANDRDYLGNIWEVTEDETGYNLTCTTCDWELHHAEIE